MSSNPLDILNAAKQAKKNKGVVKENKINFTHNTNITSIDDVQPNYLGNIIESNYIFNNPNEGPRPEYDARTEMKAIQNESGFSNINSKMPTAILESIMSNPLNLSMDGLDYDENIISENTQNRTKEIIMKLEANDLQNKNYVKTSTSQPTTINESKDLYTPTSNNDDLYNIIDNILEEKLKKYTSAIINESRNHENSPSLKIMKLGESFTFMDDDNNVYECKMIYKGKAKAKTKK